jgi:hypothetical protein
MENCIADWSNAELCKEPLNETAKQSVAQQTPGSGASGNYNWGPRYYGSNRTVTHRGVTYTPTGTNATHTAVLDKSQRPIWFSAPRSGSSLRGGFGRTGFGFGWGGG